MTSYVEFVKNNKAVQQRGRGRQTSSGNPPPTLPTYPIDTDVSHFIINDDLVREDLAEAITDGTITETMDYAAGTLSVTVEDSSRTLVSSLLSDWVSASTPVVFTSVAGQRRRKVVPKEWNEIYLTFDGRDYALAQVTKQGGQYTLTFENRAIHELRRYKRPRVWYRDTHTRAQVFQAMCQEVSSYHVEFYAPELDVIQAIKTMKGLPTPKEVQSKKMKGFAKHTKLTVKSKHATPQQVDRFGTILRVADSLHSSYVVQVAALIAAIELSNMNPKGTEFGGGSGLFGFLNSTSEAGDAHAFLSNAAKQYNLGSGQTADDLAWVVCSGRRLDAPFTPQEFGRWIPEAEAALKAWGTSLTGGSVDFTEYNRYAFKRGTDGQQEDSWSAMVRLAKEVNWFVFCADNVLYYVSDNDLIHSIPFDTISEDSPGIESIDYEIDTGKPINTVTITADMGRWECPPGVPIMIEDSGPATGRWLTYEVSRPLFQTLGEITCHLPTPPLPEPAPTTKRVTVSGKKLGQPVAVSGNAHVDAVYARALEISKKHYPYVYAGGHGTAGAADHGNNPNGPLGYDCSGYVGACFAAAGLTGGGPVPNSTAMMGWGDPGEGRLMTFWANADHVFIEFKLPPPTGHCQANTSHQFGTLAPGVERGQGAAVIPWGGNGETDATGGAFVARHWAGT